MAGGGTADGLLYLCDLVSNGDVPVESYYVALIRTTPPGFSVSGWELDEPDAPEYARAEIINDSSNWDITDTTMSNVNEVSFPPAASDWGRINYWAICDDPDGGRAFFVGQLEVPLDVVTGAVVALTPGAVGINMAGTEWKMVSL